MSDEDLLDHGRRIAALERQVAELTQLVQGEAPQRTGFASDFAPSSLAAGDDPRLIEDLERRNIIGAIKTYRELTGVGLKEAKDAVEEIARGRGISV